MLRPQCARHTRQESGQRVCGCGAPQARTGRLVQCDGRQTFSFLLSHAGVRCIEISPVPIKTPGEVSHQAYLQYLALYQLYRSTSPSTMSRLPTMATASATSAPWLIALKALMAVKQVERPLQRKGFSEPSLTM